MQSAATDLKQGSGI